MTAVLWFTHWLIVSAGMLWLLFHMHRRRSPELHRPIVILALSLTISAALLGVLGILDLQEMARRSRTDYDFEQHCWKVAALAVLATLTWAITSRNRFSFITFGTATYLAATWTLVCATL